MISVCWGIIGLIIGSFLNVIIYRVPCGESIVKPRSHCPRCNHVLSVWELIPIFSFLLLRGRCHTCGSKISWRYPLIEVLTGLLFFLWIWEHPAEPLPELLVHFSILAILLCLAFIDYDTMRLPDVLTFPLLFLGLGSSILLPMGPSGGESFASAVGVGGVFWLFAKLYPKGLGLGDVKLIAGISAFLGFPKIMLALFIASLLGSIIGILWMVFQHKKFRTQIPFGPFLVLGSYLTLFAGEQIIQAYLSLYS